MRLPSGIDARTEDLFQVRPKPPYTVVRKGRNRRNQPQFPYDPVSNLTSSKSDYAIQTAEYWNLWLQSLSKKEKLVKSFLVTQYGDQIKFKTETHSVSNHGPKAVIVIHFLNNESRILRHHIGVWNNAPNRLGFINLRIPNVRKHGRSFYKTSLGNLDSGPRSGQRQSTCLTLLVAKFENGQELVRDRLSKVRTSTLFVLYYFKPIRYVLTRIEVLCAQLTTFETQHLIGNHELPWVNFRKAISLFEKEVLCKYTCLGYYLLRFLWQDNWNNWKLKFISLKVIQRRKALKRKK